MKQDSICRPECKFQQWKLDLEKKISFILTEQWKAMFISQQKWVQYSGPDGGTFHFGMLTIRLLMPWHILSSLPSALISLLSYEVNKSG